MQCHQCGRPVSEDVTACPGCQADLSYTVIGSDGDQYGPYPLTTVRRCLAEGRITPASMVSQGGQPWVPAAQVLQPASAPPVAPPIVSRPGPRTDTTRTILIVVGIVVVVMLIGAVMLAVVMGVSFSRGYNRAHAASCLSNAKQLALAQLMWAQDHQETFPDSATWKQDTQAYVRNQQTFVCPGSNRGEDSYEMNPQLSNVKLAGIPMPRDTPLLYDAGFPDGDPPHAEGWVVAFADGHAKCVSASEAAAYR